MGLFLGGFGSSPRLRGTRSRRSCKRQSARFIPAPAGNAASFSARPCCAAVHPRACGERLWSCSASRNRRGSSPRLRGTPSTPHRRQAAVRFIPAPAGNADLGGALRSCFPVHPRACGERIARLFGVHPDDGSSPRLRGTRLVLPAPARFRRFIPAPAGNASVSALEQSAAAVHPRACGERAARVLPLPSIPGSSPRLRGTPQGGAGVQSPQRFIPAPAGNAGAQHESGDPGAVHPRACGERCQERFARPAGRGSSPRLRGTRNSKVVGRIDDRFIPAPAGNAWPTSGSAKLMAVHPRACGERVIHRHAYPRTLGSSPRLRGTPQHSLAALGGRRFIPAPAGNATAEAMKSFSSTVHPRACGERHTAFAQSSSSSGSSPRLRGTQL